MREEPLNTHPPLKSLTQENMIFPEEERKGKLYPPNENIDEYQEPRLVCVIS